MIRSVKDKLFFPLLKIARKTLVKTISIEVKNTDLGRKTKLKHKYNKDKWGFVVNGHWKTLDENLLTASWFDMGDGEKEFN